MIEEFCPSEGLAAHNALDDCKALHRVMEGVT